jgi:hypothetical protein
MDGALLDKKQLAERLRLRVRVNVGHYLDIVRDKKTRRDAIEQAQQTIIAARDETTEFVDVGSSGRNGSELSFRSPSEILAMPRNPAANFLGDRLLGVALSLVVAGIGGIGKSRLLLQLLVAFITERIWLASRRTTPKGNLGCWSKRKTESRGCRMT